MFDLLGHYSITFDPARHRYERFGVDVCSVTQVLPYLAGDDEYLKANPGIIEKAGERGHRVAKFIESVETNPASVNPPGTLISVDGVPQEEMLSFSPEFGYMQFKRDTGFNALVLPGGGIASELFVYHPTMGYAGRIDIAGFMPLTKMTGPGLVEVKASYEIPKTVGWQSAAYLEAFNKNAALYGLPKLKWRACLHLNPKKHPKTGYKLEPLTDPNDFGSFACLLGAHRLARRLNLELLFEPIDATKPATAPNPSEVFA